MRCRFDRGLELAQKERARWAYRPLRLGKRAAQGRETYIVFDADVVEKASVHGAITRLKKFLERGSSPRCRTYAKS